MMRIFLMGVFLGMSMTSGCTEHFSPPPRPNGVPADAVWSGGADGGSFIKCSYNLAGDLNECSIYNEYTGQVDVEGSYKINGPTLARDVDRFLYSGFDGHKIYLKDGSILVPVNVSSNIK